jgi:hypothetical protein
MTRLAYIQDLAVLIEHPVNTAFVGERLTERLAIERQGSPCITGTMS